MWNGSKEILNFFFFFKVPVIDMDQNLIRISQKIPFKSLLKTFDIWNVISALIWKHYMLHIFQLSYIYCIDKLATCELTLEITHLIFLFKNVTTCRQMLSVFRLIFKLFKISSKPFLVANTNKNEKKIALPSTVCHGLPENAFQVNQLYNVTWSNVYCIYL